MSRSAIILTAQRALWLSCVLAAMSAALVMGDPSSPSSSPSAPPPATPPAPKVPAAATTLANQPVVTPRDASVAAPVSPKTPVAPVAPDDQKLLNLARQLSTSTPAIPASPTDVAPAGPAAHSAASAVAPAGEKSLPGRREKDVAAGDVAAPQAPADSRPLSARRRAEGGEAEAVAPPTSAGAGGWAVTIGALTGIIGLIFVLRAGLSRWMGGVSATNRSAVVQVLSRVAVAPRNHVLLLRVGSRVLVVGDSATGMRTLAQIDDAEEIADLLAAVSSAKPSSISAGFRQMLTGFTGEYTRDERAAVGGDEQEMRVDRARDKVGGLVGKIRSIAGKGGGA